jgi:hypothetical protein
MVPNFDLITMVVSKMSISIQHPIMPLPFWHPSVSKDIANYLGSFLKCDFERTQWRLFTYAHIYVEIDLSNGLPNIMLLKRENFKWIQSLDYENTTLRCWYCHQTSHLKVTSLQVRS